MPVSTNVISHHVNNPSGKLLEDKLYLNGQQKLLRYKTEMSVEPTSHAIDITEHKKASLALIFFTEIYAVAIKWSQYLVMTITSLQQPPVNKYSVNWVVLMDKGYLEAK